MFQGIVSYISGMVEVDAVTSFWNAVDEKFEEQGRILSPEFTSNFRVLFLCKISFVSILVGGSFQGGTAPDQHSWCCFRNCMDPCWNFPREEYAALFASLTFTEAVLVALDWMQVNVCFCRSTCQHKFMGNAICFEESRANFFETMRAMRQYRALDGMNSSRHLGPAR